MPLCAEAECLEALEEQEGSERVEGRPQVAEHFDARFDRERHRSKGLAELETMVAF